MKDLRRRVIWAALVCGLAGAGINITTRFIRSVDPGIRLVINIPANRLDFIENGRLTRSYAVSVGAFRYQTPAGNYRVSRIVWNPWWHPPESKWARGRKPAPPGPRNPMGRVKLQFGKLLYIHGTVDEGQLGSPASHGCVRMANRDLIELTRIMHRYVTPGVSADDIEWLRNHPRQTRAFYLQQTVPLAVKYDLVEIRNGDLLIHPNYYGIKDADVRRNVLRALEKHGVNLLSVNRETLNRITTTRIARRVRVPLDTLVAPSGLQR